MPYYYKGVYLQNEVSVGGGEVLDRMYLPLGWTSSFNGRIVQVNGQRYKAENVCDEKVWTAEWKRFE